MTAPISPSRWRLWFLLLTALPLVSVAGYWLWNVQQRRQALALAESGDFDQAAPRLESLLERSPHDPALLAALARGYLAANDLARARPFLDRWCRASPNDPEPLRLRLKLHGKQDLEGELADARRLLELEPDLRLRLRVARLCFATGAFEEAGRHCQTYLDEEPGRRDARRLQAQIHSALGQPQRAAEVLDGLLREKGDDTTVMMARAVVYLEMRQPQQAIPLLERLLKLDPQRQRTGRYQLALAYEQAGRSEDARRVMEEMRHLQEAEVLRDAMGSQPNNPDVQVRAATAWLAKGDTAPALELLGRVLEKHPDHQAAHRTLAEYYERIGQKERAAEHRRKLSTPETISPR